MDKTCSKCKVTQPVACFSKGKNGEPYRRQCKTCCSADYKAYYQKNQEAMKKRAYDKAKSYSKLIEQYKRTNPCINCGETRWFVLDFHHRDPGQKKFSLSTGCSKSSTHVAIEIAKCDVLCSNCHRELHHLEKE